MAKHFGFIQRLLAEIQLQDLDFHDMDGCI